MLIQLFWKAGKFNLDRSFLPMSGFFNFEKFQYVRPCHRPALRLRLR
jgi:hypothetical protein